MSSAASAPNERVAAYLAKQLARNPQRHSDDIIALRAKVLRLKTATDERIAATKPAGADRSTVAAKLEAIRGQAFTGSAGELQQQVAKLPLDDFPDLQVLARRLKVILASRGQLPALSQHRDFDGEFFSVFKQVLTQPPAEVAVVREQVVASFHKRKLRRSGKAMVKLIRSNLPELYALERDWLESLLRYKAASGAPVKAASDGGSSNELSSGWLIWILVIMVGAGLRACSQIGSDDNSARQRSVPSSFDYPVRRVPRPTFE